ncbi:hypothetical protein TDB9533_04298 [Thalassocella blandensis]|nr:hypothetical protein TDB9533_04298 [Thalassocella blandensis]
MYRFDRSLFCGCSMIAGKFVKRFTFVPLIKALKSWFHSLKTNEWWVWQLQQFNYREKKSVD